MNLEKIQEMWQNDSVIDPDNLHDEYKRIKLERYNYYTGKAPAEVYAAEPFAYKVREKDAIQRHLEADEKLSQIDMKIKYYDTMLKFLEEIIKVISNRTFQIKNAIEWNKFQAGFN
jgi:hypothetical protein